MAMFQRLPERAQKLNTSLIKAWELGVDESSLGVSEIRECVYDATPDGIDGTDTIYLLAQERRGMRTRGADGALTPDRAQVYEQVVPNADRYLIIDVPLNDYKDDKIKKYDVVAYEHGEAAASGPIIDIEELAEVGDAAASLCFDGTPFFGTAHPVDKAKKSAGTWSNKLVRPAGLTFDTFSEMVEAMIGFPSINGKAVGSQPTHLLVTGDFWGMAKDICENEFPSMLAGGRNKWLGLNIKPVVVPNWTARSQAQLVDARSKRKRPYFFQEREALQLVPSGIDPMGSMEYERGFLRWITKGRHGSGFGYPNKAIQLVKS